MNSMDPRFLLNNFPDEEEDTFVPDRLFYHTDFTDTVELKKRIGKRTEVLYGEDTLLVPSSLIRKVEGRTFIHTKTFRKILEETTGRSTFLVSNSVSNEKLLEEIKKLKDSIKKLTKKVNALS